MDRVHPNENFTIVKPGDPSVGFFFNLKNMTIDGFCTSKSVKCLVRKFPQVFAGKPT